MNWLLNFLIIWVSIDIVVIATDWYAESVIRTQFPNWWKRVICDDLPDTGSELDSVV
jgi:hypothetical protein